MVSVKINNIEHEFMEGTTILEAAEFLGIKIPAMCHLKPYTNHPSCMVCVVKDLKTGNLQPSCAYPVYDGMEISTDDKEVLESRRENLELLLSDHVGDCEAPCRVGCPAFMDIPRMNRLINRGKPLEALRVVKEEIALPIILGYVCQAPCENACRRKTVDETISICQLKKYVAIEDAKSGTPYFPEKKQDNKLKIAVVGAGVAGLSASFHLLKEGYSVSVFDRNEKAGGELLNHEKELPTEMLDLELDILKKYGLELHCNFEVDKAGFNELQKDFNAVLLAAGDLDENWAEELGLSLTPLKKGVDVNEFNETNITGVYACGSLVKKQKMAVQALENGKRAAYKMHYRLSDVEIKNPRDYFNSKFTKLKPEEFEPYLLESQSDIKGITVDHLSGFLGEEAIKEAGRCMHCDCRKINNCLLREYSHNYGADQSKYKNSERSVVTRDFNHSRIVYESEKCIRCGLCVDICEKDGDKLGLSYVGRGFDMRISVSLNKEIKELLDDIAVKCAEACPTAAISLKKDDD